MSLLAGQSVALVDEIRPAAEILRETINGPERLIRELLAKVHEINPTTGLRVDLLGPTMEFLTSPQEASIDFCVLEGSDPARRLSSASQSP